MTATTEPLQAPSLAAGPARPPGGVLVTPLFAAATFLGAFLLFLVQPLIAKYILPWFGGGAAVWTTCMLFFQTALLAGYLYAHLGVGRLGTRSQAIVHAVLLAGAAAAALPAIIPSASWKPTAAIAGGNPTPRILLLLVATVGLPCVALAATSPLLHSWYSRIRPGAAVYRLFALSNAGSLLALLAYPLIVEPMLPRRAQALAWSVGMAAFAVLCATCAWLAARYAHAPVDTSSSNTPEAIPEAASSPSPETSSPPARAGAYTVVRPLLWLALPACASALLLAATNKITQDLAPVPLLWVVPLALYLLTFVIAFDRPAWYRRAPFGVALAASVALAAWILWLPGGTLDVRLAVGGVLPVLFFGCMVLHGELARLRPPTQRLTAYYLSIAAGGALGGLLVAVAAPMLLHSYSEFSIALWACCALAVAAPPLTDQRAPSGAKFAVAAVAVAALGPALWMIAHRGLPNSTLDSRWRNFYGVLTVWRTHGSEGNGLGLQHGGITHGFQFTRSDRRTLATTYYHDRTGVGLVLAEKYRVLPPGQPRRIGVIGLGAGTLAAYANAGDTVRFYEIDPNVVRIAQEPFTYLSDLRERGGACDVVLGDGRLSLENEPDQQFDVLVLDAFSGDAIPVHLLTREAFDVYARHLKPTGVMCVHASNRYLALDVVTGAAAKRLGWQAVTFFNDTRPADAGYAARWILLGPGEAPMARLRRLGATRTPRERPGFREWTDEHANLMGILE